MSENKGRLTVELRCYKTNANGEVSYNSSGSVISDNQKVTLTYGVFSWPTHLENLPQSGWGKIEVAKIYRGELDATEAESELFEQIKQEVADFYKKPEQALTPEQQKIADLEKQLAEIKNQLGGKKEDQKPETKKAEDPKADELKPLRDEYETLSGNKPNGTWGEKKLTEEINKLKAEKK